MLDARAGVEEALRVMEEERADQLRNQLVDALIQEGLIKSPQVEAAFRAAPRHLFVPQISLEEAYEDRAIPTKFEDGKPISSSSQPAMMAIMLEQLDLKAGQRVLEIGAGTGYNAALLAHIVGEGGEVITVDLDADIVEAARQYLANAGYERVRVILGDGGYGYPPDAPYDRIILTVGADDITPAWQEQLKPGGRLVLPLGFAAHAQKSVALETVGDHWESQSIQDCGFMELRGVFANQIHRVIPAGAVAHLFMQVYQESTPDPDQVYAWLTGPEHTDWETGVAAQPDEIFGPLSFWLALREPALVLLTATGDAANLDLVPPLISFGGPFKVTSTMVLIGNEGMAALTRPAKQPVPVDGANEWDALTAFPLIVRQYGSEEAPARQMVQQVRAWQEAGRPSSRGLRMRVYPRGADIQLAEGEYLIEKMWTKVVVDWPEAT